MQSAEIYVEQSLRLVVWRHAGHLVKTLEIAVNGRSLPKPYLGTPISDGAAGFLAVADSPVPGQTASLLILDAAGAPVFRSDQVRVRPLDEARDGLESPEAWEKLLARMLRHGPEKLPTWTDPLTKALIALERGGNTARRAGQESDGTPGTSVSAVHGAPGLQAAIDFVDGLRVSGWARNLAEADQTLKLQFEVNGVPAGTAVANQHRPDLDRPGAEFHHGFHVLLRKEALGSPWRDVHRLSVRDLSSGRAVVDAYPLRYRAGQDERDIASFGRRIERLEQTLLELREQMPVLRRRASYALDDYDLWFRDVHQPALSEITGAAGHSGVESPLPGIGVVIPLTAGCDLAHFERVLDSLARQASAEHQYLVVNWSQTDQAYKQLARSYLDRVPRLSWVDLRDPSPADVLKSVLRYSGTRQIFLLKAGEMLGRFALDWIARAFAKTKAQVVYADSDRIDAQGRHRDPDLRPDFNPDLLLSTPYIGSFVVARGLLEALATEIDGAEGVWQYDLLLRASEHVEPKGWLHIAGVLTHDLGSGDANPEQPHFEEALSVLRAHLHRVGAPAQAALDSDACRADPEPAEGTRAFAARLRWEVPDPAPKVSIIIPTRDAPQLLRTCVDSIRDRTAYPDYELLLVDHESTDAEARRDLDSFADRDDGRVIPYTGSFNWSAMNNLAASHAAGQVFCFLNNDTEVMTPDWLSEMVGHALRPGIGAVGAKLLLRDGTLQHGGIVLGVHGVGEHAFTGLPADRGGYRMRACLTQNIGAVTGACLVCRREVFEDLGGFEMVNLGVAFNDVDFCLRLREAGYRILWTPHARLYHEGSKTRGYDLTSARRARLDGEIAFMREHWGRQLDHDPHYPRAFERYELPYVALTGADFPLF